MMFINRIFHLSDLVMRSGKYDGKKHDWGQWVCVLLYGKDWMNHPEFKKIDDMNLLMNEVYDPHAGLDLKLERMKEWLEEVIRQKEARKMSAEDWIAFDRMCTPEEDRL